MRRLSLVGSTSLSALFCAGFLVGCGDNIAKTSLVGGTGGSGEAGNGGDGVVGGAGGEGGEGGVGGEGGLGGIGGAGGQSACPVVAFVNPAAGAMFGAADDASGMSCAMGFKHDVTVTVMAADGTVVELHGQVTPGPTVSPPLLATGTVTNSQVVFPSVQLSEGMTQLSVEVAGTPCPVTATVSVSCNLPTCAISAPTHDTLNGVAATAGGDRASSTGSAYQAAFTVTTNIEDGQPVTLSITNAATPAAAPATASATAMSGKATFAGVTLTPDGQYTVAATCTSRALAVGHSAKAMFTVDTTPPVLTVTGPANGASLTPADLTNGAFPVCGTTTSADAVNLPASARFGSPNNFCVARGGSPICTPVTAVATSTCVNIPCGAAGAFDLVVTLYDAAGNPQQRTVTGLTCTSTLPAVQIVAPLSDAPNFSNPARRLLAATSTQTLRDADGVTAGAQTTVVACTDTAGSAQLRAGHRGDTTLTALGTPVTTVAAVSGDNCPNGFGFVARFPGVTLPESTEAADGTLTAATEIRVDLTSTANAALVGTSGPTDLWVDSVVPTLTEKTPTPLCGSTQAATGATTVFTSDVALNSTTPVVTLNVVNGLTSMFGPPTYVAGTPTGTATFTSVAFPAGVNTVVATATDPAGNTSSLTPPIPMPTCTVTVGTAPVVTFTSPAAGKNLCANGNTLTTCVADATAGGGAAAGWQGDISVHVTSDGAPLATGLITFTIGGGAAQTATLSASGDAVLTGITIADGVAVVITATTENVPGHGVGTASHAVIVDTLPPGGATAVTATVLERRQTSFTLGWTAPDDNGQPVAGYDIHVKVRNPTTGNPCGTELVAVPFSGAPVAAGSVQSIAISNLFIETDYCFTVAAQDVVGNLGPTANATGRALFQVTTLSVADSATQTFGYEVDGTGDFGSPAGANGFQNDTLSDLIVGTLNGQRAYLFLGRAGGYRATPDVVFTGPASKRFGAGVVNAGDIDGDTLSDIAIAAPGLVSTDVPAVYIFSRKTAPWASNNSWPATLDYTQASYVITPDATFAGTGFGFIMTRMGNFDGTGRDDLAITALAYDPVTGTDAGRMLIIKGSDTFGSITLPDPINTYVIDGESAGLRFGSSAVVLADNTLVVSASAASMSAGRVYALRPPLLMPNFVADATNAFDISVYTAGNSLYGQVLATMGPIGPSTAALAVAATGPAGNFVDLLLTPPADGVFPGPKGSAPMPTIRFTSSATPSGLGAAMIGGVVPGTNITTSFIGGDLIPDLVITSASSDRSIYIVNGATIPSLPPTVDLATSPAGVVTVKSGIPADLTNNSRTSTLIVDLNGDGYADFASGEGTAARPGRTLVFW